MSFPAPFMANDLDDLMGASGLLPPLPGYHSLTATEIQQRALQAAVAPYLGMSGGAVSGALSNLPQQWNQGLAAQANLAQQSSVVLSIGPMGHKATRQMNRVCDELPMRVAAQIERIEFHGGPGITTMVFVVKYINGHKLEFEDVDAFPAAEHIARIVLECP
jgi:hypothetical protein